MIIFLAVCAALRPKSSDFISFPPQNTPISPPFLSIFNSTSSAWEPSAFLAALTRALSTADINISRSMPLSLSRWSKTDNSSPFISLPFLKFEVKLGFSYHIAGDGHFISRRKFYFYALLADPLQFPGKLPFILYRAVSYDEYILTYRPLEIARLDELPVEARRLHLERIGPFYRVRLVEDPPDLTVQAAALADRYADRLIYGKTQDHPPP